MNMGTVCILLVLTVIHVTTASIVNVAEGKPASMSSSISGYRARTAVDGNTDVGGWTADKIINTDTRQTFAWWKVDLQRDVQNATVRIYFRTEYKRRRNGVKLYRSISSFPTSNPTSQGQLCHTVTGDPSGSDIPDVYNVTCPGRWHFLLLYTDTDNDEHGPVLDFGEVEVWACSEGTYGEDCSKSCSARNCVTMTTSCERDGRCPAGCQLRWTGLDCIQALPPCTNNNIYGLNCDKLCSDRKCKAPSTSSCDRLSGRCPGGCEDGWREEDCTQECDSGFYGASCRLVCTNRTCIRASSTCDHVTGRCVGGCFAGYKELDCIYACDSGYYGPGCSLLCSNRKCVEPSTECNHVTGQCQYGCKPGYKGIDCVEECDSGTYGNCSLSCTDRNCLGKSAECHHVTGQCESECQAGYKGMDCRHACDLGINYGVNCLKSCTDRQCNRPSLCDTRTGQCIDGCQVGWTGVDCTSQCPDGTFGSDCTSCTTRHCLGESDCPVDGTCPQGCQDGWTGNTCLEECSRGVYGPGCSITCGNCSSDYACHHVTGTCPSGCKAGWRTEKCNEVCSEDTYGPGCTEKCGKCDGVCDSVDGRCPAGCMDGYCGIKCDLALIGDVNGKELACFGVASLVGAVIGAFLVVVLLAVGIHIYLIRQGRLQWIKASEAKQSVQGSLDFTRMSSIVARAADVSEIAQPGNQAHNNDYAVLDTGQMQGHKDYDVIQPKNYQNL